MRHGKSAGLACGPSFDGRPGKNTVITVASSGPVSADQWSPGTWLNRALGSTAARASGGVGMILIADLAPAEAVTGSGLFGTVSQLGASIGVATIGSAFFSQLRHRPNSR